MTIDATEFNGRTIEPDHAAGDFNGDGRVVVRLHQYTDRTDVPAEDQLYYQTASDIELIGDISDCESYFFLTDDPQKLQRDYQIFAGPDGNPPSDSDYSVSGKVVLCSESIALCEALDVICPASDEELSTSGFPDSGVSDSDGGTGQTEGKELRDYFEALWLGRRCFYSEKRCRHSQECAQLWEELIRPDETED